MQAQKASVLVVDDDEVVLAVVADALEDVGFRVVTLQSPIGATQVIVREGISLAIIDVNLPVMQGDNVVRLLQTWDRVKDIPIVVISSAPLERIASLRQELPQIRFVSKADLRTTLAPTVRQLLAQRVVKAPQNVASSRPATSPQDLTERFAQQVQAELSNGMSRWIELSRGSTVDQESLAASLRRLLGQAQLLGLEVPSGLLDALLSVVEAMGPHGSIPPFTDAAVENTITGLLSLDGSGNGSFALRPESLRLRLVQAAATLKAP